MRKVKMRGNGGHCNRLIRSKQQLKTQLSYKDAFKVHRSKLGF